MTHEYKVIPAPRRAEKAKGARTTADRFANTLAEAINAMARDGWEYLRAEVLPCEERSGLTGRKITDQHVLVFRKALPPPPAAQAAPSDAAADLPPPLRPADPVGAARSRPGGLSALAGIGRPAPRAEGLTPPRLRTPGAAPQDPDAD